MLSVSEIQKFIDNDIVSEKKKFAGVGQRYYEGEHDIRNYRLFYYNSDGKLIEDKVRSNVKISHPFFTELSDQLSAYMLSFDENPMVAKDTAEGLQEHLDNYFDDEFWSEIGDVITGSYTKGFEYLFAYKNAADKLSFQCADSMGVVECREKDTVFGYDAVSNKLMAGGEAGSETVVGTQSLMNMIQDAVNNSGNRDDGAIQALLEAIYNWMRNGGLYKLMIDVLTNGVELEFDNREIARLVKKYA